MSEVLSLWRSARARAAGVSVIIPAHNAAGTLRATLESLRAQCFTNWEAIVIDDGSSDGTSVLAKHFSRSDARIRVRTTRRGGEAAARNHGIVHARNDWLLFLDADDTIAPGHMQRLMDVLSADPFLDGAYCRWIRVAHDGTRCDPEGPPQPGQLFDAATRYCPFAIHACIVRRRLVEDLGGFDASLATCPDWDLWQRVARTGCRMAFVDEPLAYYWMRPGSAGGRALQVLADGWTVIERGHRFDPRVEHPDPRYHAGAEPHAVDASKADFLCWVAGLLIGQDHRAEFLVYRLQELPDASLDRDRIAQHLLLAPLVARGSTPAAWPALWPGTRARLRSFLDALEIAAHSPGLADDVERRVRSLALPPSSLAQSVQVHRTAAAAPSGIILLYHRIAALSSDPWQLAVTQRHFAEQLDVLDSWARVVSLRDLVSGTAGSTHGRRLAAITFDDGYADNLHEAMPALRRRQFPATIFTVASAADRPADFWWDELSHLLLECALPARLEMRLGKERLILDTGEGPEPVSTSGSWRAWEPPVTPMQRFFVQVWNRLRVCEPHVRDSLIDELYSRSGHVRQSRDVDRRLTHAELRRLAGAGIEIGAHTVNHPSLAALPANAQASEIAGSRRILEDVVDAPIVSFAYPFGTAQDFTSETVRLVRAAGFRYGCSNIARKVERGTDVHELPRVHVPDLDGAAFETWLLNIIARLAAA